MLEVPRKVASCIWKLIRLISNQEVIPSSEGRSISFEAAYCLIFERLDQRIFDFIRYRKYESLSFEICFEMSGIFMKVILPAERSIPSNDFVVFSQTNCKSALNTVTDLMEVFDSESMIAGSIDEFKRNLVIEKAL